MTKNTSNHIMNIYRWNYLTQTLLSVFISTYLPVILGEVRNFDAKEISFIVLGQIPLLFKPLLGFLSERRIEEKIERKDSINKHAVTKSRKTLITGGISLYIIAISI